MSIQIGRLAIHYNGLQLDVSRTLVKFLRLQMQARQERIDHQSVITIIIRRWLIAPVVAGIMFGMLLQ